MEIEDRVVQSAKNEAEFEKLLQDYRAFIASCASRTVGRFVDTHDDEMSIALIAFSEAVRRYRPGSGKFLNFAGNIIRCRLIDELRARGREIRTVSIEGESEAGEGYGEIDNVKDLHAEDFFNDILRQEIQILSEALKEYGFSFMDIAKCSPKHEKTKRACASAARCILEHAELLEQLKRLKQMPVKNIAALTKVSRKTIERHRNYIVCLVEILFGEYAYLTEYVKFVREVAGT